MINLDNINLEKTDPHGMYHDLVNFGLSFLDGFETLAKMPIPPHYIKCSKIVFIGMGGSGIAGLLTKHLVNQSARLPIGTVSNYSLPNWVDNQTLVVAMSYSGDTEETIEAFIEAFKRGARLISFSTGGRLEDLARKYGAPFYRHQGAICGQARMSTLRYFGALISLLNRLGQYEVQKSEILQARNLLDNLIIREYVIDMPISKNQAKKLAQQIFDKIPIIWAADHLEAVAHRFKADFNENSKSLSYFEPIPEMNHKSLAGSEFPKPITKNIFHLLLKSKFGQPENILRINLTADFFKKRKFQTEIINFPQADSPLTEILIASSLSSFTSFYLGLLYGIDPTPVEAVKEFKNKLGGN